MKRVTHVLIGLLLMVLLISLGAGLIYVSYNQECWGLCLDALRAQRGWATLAGIVLLALVVVYLISGIQRRPTGDQYLAFRNNGATVSILLRAVNEFVSRIGDEFAAIVSMKPSIRPRGSSISIDLDVRVKAGTQIPELCQLLEERVRESVRQNLGISDIKKIRMNVKDIVGDTPKTDELQGQGEG